MTDSIASDVQRLEPGAMWEGFVLDATGIGGGVVRFHGTGNTIVYWQTQDYAPWPIVAEGFARTSGQQPNPTLKVGNTDGSISLLCLSFEDLVGATITRHRTFVKYLDEVNFADGNPTADPTEEFAPEVWFIERKSEESPEAVTFELSTVLDFTGVKLPRRQIIANHCPASWIYRGARCGYTGPAVADANDNPTSDMALDRCGKRLSSCKLRVWPDKVLNFGGFPAAGLVRQ